MSDGIQMYKVVYYNRAKKPDPSRDIEKGDIEKVCFEVPKGNGQMKRKYLYRRNGILQMKDGNRDYAFIPEKLQVMHYPQSKKLVKAIMHKIR